MLETRNNDVVLYTLQELNIKLFMMGWERGGLYLPTGYRV